MKALVTLSLEADVARLVTVKGQQVVSWGSIALSPSLAENGSDGVAQQVRSLLQSVGVSASGAIVDLNYPTLLTRHLELPKIPDRYLPQVVAKEVEPTIPFSLDEVDIAWQASRNGKGYQVLALCVPTQVIESHVRMLKAAGIRPTVIYSKPLALAHAVAEPDAVLLNLEPSRTDITLVLQGLPRITHHAHTAFDADNRKEAMPALAALIERVVQFRQSAESAELVNLPVVLAGSLADAELAAELGQVCSREIRPFKTQFDCPADFPPSDYAINLGLATAAGQPRVKALAFPNINMLPARHRPSPFPWMQAMLFGLLLGMAAATPYVAQQVDARAATAQSLTSQASSLERKVQLRSLQLRKVGALQQDLERAQALTQQMDDRIDRLASSRSFLIDHLEAAAMEAIPAGVVQLSGKHGDDEFTLEALAPGYDKALQYAAELRASGLFLDLGLTEVRAGTDGITLKITAYYSEQNPRAPPQPAKGPGTAKK